MLDSLARLSTVAAAASSIGAVLLVVVAGAVGGPVAGLLDSDDDFDPPSAEAVQAREAIAGRPARRRTPDVVALVRLGAPRRLARRAGEAARGRRAPPRGRRWRASTRTGRAGRRSWCRATGARATSRSRCATARTPTRSSTGSRARPGVDARRAGALIGEQAGEQVQEDLARAELLAFPLLFLVSLVVFRGLVAALLPLAVGDDDGALARSC